MKHLTFLATIFTISLFQASHAAEHRGLKNPFILKYHYNLEQKLCLDTEGKQGLNKGNVIECGTADGIDSKTWYELTTFARKHLMGIHLSDANLSHFHLKKVDMQGAIAERSNFDFIKIKTSNLKNTSFNDSYFYSSLITDSSLENANFQKAVLVKTSFVAVKANAAQFQFADLQEALIEGIFTNTDFSSAKLKEAKFKNIDLSGANFSKATLLGAKFINANLANTSFKDANLLHADFTDAQLEGATFTGALFDKETKLPFTHEKALSFGMVFIE